METTRIQFPFTCFAVLSTICGFVCSIVGNCRGVKITLVAAVLYILSGLSLAVGVILYISRINDELSIPIKNCTDFEYRYGWSFYLMGIAFLMAEISAVISVKLYLVRCSYHISDMFHIIPELEEQFYRDACVSGIRYSDPNSQTLIW
ncbi:hypothetical protein DPMN_027242 [Dreissena polymorpha]|uniref:Uncharacterized protein n=1 Tax=Dreissena polymorpha TaxID=45954 RepID=A0A9D4RDA3_DREPO|nr:hypothetical protein DPMN_027242 [Dreissena polymorpha]